jgi:hypothetical protein
VYEHVSVVPPDYKPFTQYKDWVFNDYFTNGDVMLMRINDSKYRVLHAVKVRRSEVYNMHDINHINRGLTKLRVLSVFN